MNDVGDNELLATTLFVGFVLFSLAMWALALRYGPRRGYWNQPAAALRRPGRRTFLSMYAIAALHVIAGIAGAIAVPGAGIGVLLVLVVTAGFYVLCAHSYALASSAAERRRRRRAR